MRQTPYRQRRLGIVDVRELNALLLTQLIQGKRGARSGIDREGSYKMAVFREFHDLARPSGGVRNGCGICIGRDEMAISRQNQA